MDAPSVQAAFRRVLAPLRTRCRLRQADRAAAVRQSPDERPNCDPAEEPGRRTVKIVLTLCIILVGLAGRSGADKILALRGGPELVAYAAQLGSVIDLVAAVALAGVGGGLAVLVAQISSPERQHRLLLNALKIGLAIAAPAMLIVAGLGISFPAWAGGARIPGGLFVLGAVAGCICVVPGMVGNYWLGQQRRGRMLGLAAASALLPAAAAYSAPIDWLLASVVIATALPSLVLLFVPRPRGAPPPEPESAHDRGVLSKYIPAGISIGVLSPASTVAVRSIVAEAMSWDSAGYIQALWRISDWVASVAGGVLGVYFLPRLSAAWRTPGFSGELRRAALATLVPSAIALVLLFAVHREATALLYDPGFRLGDAAVALFFAGTLVRIAAWVPLFALFAMRRTLAISIGEFLSLPLFAVLLAVLSDGLTLERAGVLWLVSYAAYGVFNVWAVRRG